MTADEWRKQRDATIAKHFHELFGIVVDALCRRGDQPTSMWLEAMRQKVATKIGMIFDDCVQKPPEPPLGKPPTAPPGRR